MGGIQALDQLIKKTSRFQFVLSTGIENETDV